MTATFKKEQRHGMVYRGKPWCVTVVGDYPTDTKVHRFKTQEEADTFIEESGGEPQPKLVFNTTCRECGTVGNDEHDALCGHTGTVTPEQTLPYPDCYCYEPEVKEFGRPCGACQKRMDEEPTLRDGKTYAEWLETPHRHRGRVLSCDLCGKVASHPLHRQPGTGEGE